MSNYEYKAAKYEHVGFWVEKGTRVKYRSVSKTVGLTQSEMIRLAVDEFMKNHAPDICDGLNLGQSKITGDEKHLIDAFNKLSPEVQKALLKFLDAMQR